MICEQQKQKSRMNGTLSKETAKNLKMEADLLEQRAFPRSPRNVALFRLAALPRQLLVW